MDKSRLKFISYDGAFPNLCRGTLIVSLDGKEIVFPEYCMCSGGSVRFTQNGKEIVMQGKWRITEFPIDFPLELREELEDLVNANVRWGCCGGCV